VHKIATSPFNKVLYYVTCIQLDQRLSAFLYEVLQKVCYINTLTFSDMLLKKPLLTFTYLYLIHFNACLSYKILCCYSMSFWLVIADFILKLKIVGAFINLV